MHTDENTEMDTTTVDDVMEINDAVSSQNDALHIGASAAPHIKG